MKTKIVFFLSSLLLIIGCTKTEEISYNVSPVVEGYLSPANILSVKVTMEIPYNPDDEIQVDFTSLVLTVSDGQSNCILKYMGDSIFESDSSFVVDQTKSYTLDFDFNGEHISAYTIIPEKPTGFVTSATSIEVEDFDPSSGTMPTMPDPISLNWDNPEGDYHLVVVENIETDPESIRDNDDENRPERIFRNEPDQGDGYEIPPMTFEYYGTHRIILYKLNADYAALYSDNGNNSQNLQAPPSNITNGLGIFTGMNSDTLFIEVTEP